MLQDNVKMKEQYLRSLLFYLFETLQAVRLGKGISLHFNFRCHGNQNQNDCPLLKNKRSIVHSIEKEPWSGKPVKMGC